MIETDYYCEENTNITLCGDRVRQFAWGSDHEVILSGLQRLPRDCITFDHFMLMRKCVSHQVNHSVFS